MELRNRIVMSPMETMYGTPEGLPSDRTVAYFAARAAGGVGLVTVGATGIDPLHPETPGGLHLGTDDAVATRTAAGRRGARARRPDPAADRARRARRARPRDARRRLARAVGHPVVPHRTAVDRGHHRSRSPTIIDLYRAAVAPGPRGGVRRHRAARRARLHVPRLVPRAAAQPARRPLPRHARSRAGSGWCSRRSPRSARRSARTSRSRCGSPATSGSPAGARRTRPRGSRRCWSRPASTPSTSAVA